MTGLDHQAREISPVQRDTGQGSPISVLSLPVGQADLPRAPHEANSVSLGRLPSPLFKRAFGMAPDIRRVEIGDAHPLSARIYGVTVDHPGRWPRRGEQDKQENGGPCPHLFSARQSVDRSTPSSLAMLATLSRPASIASRA